MTHQLCNAIIFETAIIAKNTAAVYLAYASHFSLMIYCPRLMPKDRKEECKIAETNDNNTGLLPHIDRYRHTTAASAATEKLIVTILLFMLFLFSG